jgi:protoheme IX farnesyltransferase
MSGTTALIYATILGVLGTLLLYWQTNRLTVMVALIGLFVYVVVYSMWFKRHSIYGTLIGSISGAVPPVVGYCAATNRFDLGAIILFVILSLWQMPHSFAIAIFRLKDYTAASISILPVKKGIAATKIQMIAYTVAFAVAVCFMTMFGYTGFAYLIIVGGSGALWVRLAFKGLSAQDDRKWARKMFLYSIIIIIIFSIMLALDVVR